MRQSTKSPSRSTPGRAANIDLYYEIVVRNIATGKVVRRRSGRSHSFLKAFIQGLCMMWGNQVLTTAAKDTGGTLRTINNSFINCLGAINDATQGIVAGTGSAAVSPNDYVLGALIAHGTGAGQLQYQAETYDNAVTVAGSVISFTTTRALTNGSGETITINEIGMIGIITANDFLVIRDTVTPTNVDNGEAATITYKIKATA